MSGWIDVPAPGTKLRAGVAMPLEGWVLFDGQPAESVEAYVDAEPPVPVRNNVPRLDLWEAVSGRPESDPRSIAAGFSDLVPISSRWAGQELSIVLRARSLGGEVWTSEPVKVQVLPEATGPEEFDCGSPFLNVAGAWPGLGGVERDVRNSPPRLCVFTHSLRLGGGELYLQELLLRLARDHHFQILVISPDDGVLKDELRAAGVSVHVTSHHPVEPARYLARVAELKTLLAAWQADAVIVNTLGMFAGADAALEAGLPVFWAIHESFALETFSFLNWGNQELHPAVRGRWMRCLASASTIFESQATLEMFQQQVPGLQGSVVRYGIDLSVITAYRADHDRAETRSRLGFAPGELVLLCMGVIQERKAQLALAWAFAEVARVHPSARLVMVGDHPSAYAGAVRQVVNRLGMADRITIEPIQPDTYQWYLAADIVVSASDTESLPRSVLEAMAFGRPVLAADVFGLSEVVRDGENGWLCRARSCASLIAGLKRVLITEPADLQAMSARCEADARAFDGAGYASAYTEMILAATAEKPATAAGCSLARNA